MKIHNNYKQLTQNEQRLHQLIIRKEDVKEMMELQDVNLNCQGLNGETLLHVAVSSKNHEAIQTLLMHGADLHMVNAKGYSPLFLAAFRGNDEAITILLKHGADVNSTLPNGANSAFIAGYSNKMETVKLLISEGADREYLEADECYNIMTHFRAITDGFNLFHEKKQGNQAIIKKIAKIFTSEVRLGAVKDSELEIPEDVFRKIVSSFLEVKDKLKFSQLTQSEKTTTLLKDLKEEILSGVLPMTGNFQHQILTKLEKRINPEGQVNKASAANVVNSGKCCTIS